MRLFCFGGSDPGIESFRSKDLALLTLFNIGRKDCISLLSVLEKVDVNYHRTISGIDFATKFCGEYKETFLYLLRIYFALIVPKKIIAIEPLIKTAFADDESVHDLENDDNQSQNMMSVAGSESVVSKIDSVDLLEAAITIDSMPYHYLLSFWLIFMSIPDGDLMTWLFWLCYPAQEKKCDHNNIEGLISILWPLTDKNKDKTKQKIEFLKKKAQNMLIIIDPDDLNPSKLRVVDVNTGGAWTKPLRQLRKQMRRSTLGYFYWRRVNAQVDRVCANIDESYLRLKEPYKLSRWGKRNKAIVGDRKIARKDVRVVVRLQLNYLHLLSDYDGSEVTGSRRNSRSAASSVSGDQEEEQESVVHYLYVKISTPFIAAYKRLKSAWATSAKVFPMGSGDLGASFKRSGSSKFNAKYSASGRRPSTANWLVSASAKGLRRMTLQREEVVVDKEEFISLELKYKEVLEIPIDTVYERVDDAQSRAARMLALCDEEVGSTTFEVIQPRRDGSVTSSVTDDGYGTGRGTRAVVVDVSSSSEGHSVHEQEGESLDEGDDEVGYFDNDGGDSDNGPEPMGQQDGGKLKGIMKK